MRCLVLLGAFSMSLMADSLSQGERDRSMSHLHATRKMFLDALAGLSEAQLNWKPSPERWSVAEVAEHLAVTEQQVFLTIQRALKEPAAPERKAETKGKDELILKAVPDRSRKVQAPEVVRPTGRWNTGADLVAAFKANRDRTIEFVENTPEDLRSHFAPHPFLGLFDSYQWTVFLAAHTDRHVQQMKEVLAEAGFPKR